MDCDSKSHGMDLLVLNKFPFDTLPSLHSITASILLSHSKEVNHRWLLPVFNAQLYLYGHLADRDPICAPSLVVECHHCLSLFPAVYLFSLLFTSVPAGNPLLPDFLVLLDHSLHIATSPPRNPLSLISRLFFPRFPRVVPRNFPPSCWRRWRRRVTFPREMPEIGSISTHWSVCC